MASNRHLGRIISLQSLYEYEFRSKAGDASAEIDLIVAKNIVPYYLADGEEINPTVYSYDEALLSTHRFLFWDVPEREAKWVRRYYFRIPEKKHYTEP